VRSCDLIRIRLLVNSWTIIQKTSRVRSLIHLIALVLIGWKWNLDFCKILVHSDGLISWHFLIPSGLQEAIVVQLRFEAANIVLNSTATWFALKYVAICVSTCSQILAWLIRTRLSKFKFWFNWEWVFVIPYHILFIPNSPYLVHRQWGILADRSIMARIWHIVIYLSNKEILIKADIHISTGVVWVLRFLETVDMRVLLLTILAVHNRHSIVSTILVCFWNL